MTLLLNCHGISKAYGSRRLFRNLSLGIRKGDKIGLIGPNGTGKSSLLKILAGVDSADEGEVSARKGTRCGYVPQTSSYPDISIENVLLQSFKSEYGVPLHERDTKARMVLSKLGFKDTSQLASSLSGGWKKRLDIAKELVNDPEVLFLDEPTNHLDLEGILWLEKFIQRENIAFLVTSHDRYFLQNTATKMLELNPVYPEGLFSSDGNYEDFLVKRDEFASYQQQCEKTLASKVRSEVDWLRRSPKARTTKSQARVQAAGRLIDDLSDVRTRNKQSKAKIDFEASDRQTRKLAVGKNLSKTLGGRKLFSGVDITISPGMRLGIVGPNGCGKTTLLKIIAGEISPDMGTIKHADDLRIVYFDQHRQLLDTNDTLKQALAPNSDYVIYRGQNIHVNSWAKRFLFDPSRMDLPISQLSGGERARIGIARLMLQPADLLLLDEPTNDLDIVTLENLEESLCEFPGAIVFITHDRALLDSLATCVLGLGIEGQAPILADYLQWEEFLKQHKPAMESAAKQKKELEALEKKATPVAKLSFKEKKELEEMESTINTKEKAIALLEEIMHKQTGKNDLIALQKTCEELDKAHKELDSLFARWQELEARMH